ncbi:uncharacterized protein [Syngnathus scovelli]|uniref:uncharacterized protein n=1 Tax=Syngnathus scovelli TaxID=161590 RepID=UPI00210F637F|nr:uncharacterized protein LOC125980081 [Syngnathus scovelli]
MFKLSVLLVALFRAHASVRFASLGDDVSLPCYFEPGAKYLSWYKQVAGDPPQVLLSFYSYGQNSQSHERIKFHTGENFFHLSISDVELSDTAMYYCGQSQLNIMTFESAIFLVVKESGRLSVFQHPTSITVSPGGSATLNCTMHPGTSDGGHMVYWFRKASGDSHLIYAHSENTSGCVTASDSGCVYMLSKRDVTLSDAGTYYCAVASCGEIVFGKGSKMGIRGEKIPFYILLASLLASLLVIVCLTVLLCKMRQKDNKFSGKMSQLKVPDGNTDENEDDPALPYVALEFRMRSSNSRRQRGPEESVYSGLRLQHAD